ncbi:flagellar hook-length control protein FliK [Fulvimonas sp. R45]|uniref:flagellar hook-length control protein FliK n=1 Tax=Fulvimonas sp. R45 TaxID=3045937 RepID=UPI00265FFD24|nr:flagellar hook-length control protein FliK [Fulvimonas sp. R45]MDO1530416.1 flagellar hook-length control protein FliK [Fulvimonas sp. R45]
MIIQPTSLAALTWAGAASGAGAEAWRIGSVLSARPLGTTPQGLLVLQIGALTVETDTPGAGARLPAQFQVRVLSLGAQPQFEVVGPASAGQALGRALRERLPQQNGYAPLLATVAALAQRPLLRVLPAYVRTALAQLEQSLRTPAEIADADGLRQAVLRSGLFLEADLLATPDAQPVEDDWKAALLRLAASLQDLPRGTPGARVPADTPPPLQQRGLQAQPRAPLATEWPEARPDDAARLLPQLRDATHAALARLEVTQLEAGALPARLVEIPLQGTRGHDILQLRIEPGAADAGEDAAWTLGFAIDLPALGPLHGELQLRGLRLAVRLWAQHAPAVERLERRFAALRERLAGSGLLLDQLSCQHGLPQPPGPYSQVLLKATA